MPQPFGNTPRGADVRKKRNRPPRTLVVYKQVVDYVSNAEASLGGAEFYFHQIQRQVHGWQQMPGADHASVNELHWHMRAFFWELVSAVEMTTHAIEEAGEPLADFEDALDESWWSEIDEWRNFAHRAFLFIQGEYREDGSLIYIWLPQIGPDSAQHEALDRLAYYIEKVRQLLVSFLPSKPAQADAVGTEQTLPADGVRCE